MARFSKIIGFLAGLLVAARSRYGPNLKQDCLAGARSHRLPQRQPDI
jgi:hypothetical protein